MNIAMHIKTSLMHTVNLHMCGLQAAWCVGVVCLCEVCM
jgi:hypothetical protein